LALPTMPRWLICLFLAVNIIGLQGEISAEVEWTELRGDHFIIFYTGEKQFAKDVLSASEKYYLRIADDLGYQRYENFWQWDNRVKIYIYPDRETFQDSSLQPEWSEGLANYNRKEIISYEWHEGFVETLLAHEIAHLVFRDYVGFNGGIPLWLDEGVAQWEEHPKREVIRDEVRELLKKDELIPLAELTKMDIRGSADEAQVRRFYIQAAMLVGFLVEEYGASRFVNFCRNLRDGKNLDDALRFAYPTNFRKLDDLEEKFREHLGSGE